ncbi:MAG: glutamate--cysteine ligase, partial [Candidatus Omnitrophota bacterium]
MNEIIKNKLSPTMSTLIEHIKLNQDKLNTWLNSQEGSNELPLYSSVDIRDAGFKMAVVDTNIFPAGFNNICKHGIEDSAELIKEAIYKRVAGCKNILIIAEEHTRNTWYLENLRILEQIISKASFNTKIATFLDVQPAFCENTMSVELETATGNPIRIYCFNKILEDMKSGKEKFCLAIMNNDLTTGIPDILKSSEIPIYPSIQAGWHSRLKSHHFDHTRDIMNEFAEI